MNPNSPSFVRLNAMAQEQLHPAIDMLANEYEERGTFKPDLTASDEDVTIQYIDFIYATLSTTHELIELPPDKREPFYFACAAAKALKSRSTRPLIKVKDINRDTPLPDMVEIGNELIFTVEGYLDRQYNLNTLIQVHFDQISDCEYAGILPERVLAGYAFMLIEAENLKLYRDELLLAEYEYEFDEKRQ